MLSSVHRSAVGNLVDISSVGKSPEGSLHYPQFPTAFHESQRDSVTKPRVARHELPWERPQNLPSTPPGFSLLAERGMPQPRWGEWRLDKFFVIRACSTNAAARAVAKLSPRPG